MIVVTGATGHLGGLIVRELLDRLPASQLGASVRDPAKAVWMAELGVRVRHGDYSEIDSLPRAFEGASQLLLISSNAAASGENPVDQHRAAIDAALKAGVGRILYTSHQAASASSAFSPMHTHAATEQMLRDAGVAWTALRNGFYAETIEMVINGAAESGTFATSQDGPVSWTTHGDLAVAAAEILIQEGRFEGPTPPLAAGEALDFGDVAKILTELHGRPIIRRVVCEEEVKAHMLAEGVPSAAVAITLEMYRAAHDGEFAADDGTLANILGHKTASVAEMLAKSLRRSSRAD
jgi:uncharacterized protein YbjT (DUF2867 family)